MSILIKGMEMPTRCWDCLMNTYGYCMASEHSDIIPSDASIPEWCPLVSIPQHGRLIDADALLESIKEAKKKQPEISDVYDEDYFAVAEWVSYAPTIISANESDMDSFIRIFEEDDEEDGMDSFIRILKD